MPTPEEIKKQVLETSQIVENTLKSVAAQIGDIFQDALSEADGITKIFGKDVEKQLKSLARSTDKMVENQLKINAGQTSSKDITKQILEYQTKREVLEKRINNLMGEQPELASQLKNQLNDVDAANADYVKGLEEQRKELERIENKLGVLGKLVKGLNKIPILGNLIDADKVETEMKKAAAAGTSSFKAGLTAIGKSMKSNLLDPLTLFTFLLNQALKANAQTVELGKALGKSSEQYRENLADAARSSTNINVTTENLVGASNELAQATGFAYEFNVDQLETQIKLTKQVGLQADEAANVQKFSILTGKTSEQTYKSFVKGLNATSSQLKVGINFKTTLAEALKVSGQLSANLGNDPIRIAKAVVQAKAFGFTLEQVAKSGESLLNFESSIENELKAELLTGKQLNLERARAAALAGDQATLAEEIAKNIGTAADFTKMNVLQQKALAESVGMTADELANSLTQRERAIESGKSLAQVQEEDRIKALERQNIQDKFNQSILKLQDFFGNLVAGPVGQLLDSLTKIIGLVSDVLQPVLNVVFKPLVWAVSLLGKMEGLLKGIVGVAVAYKGVQLGINIAKQTQYALNLKDLALEEGKLTFKRISGLVEKESLATKIAMYAVSLKDLAVENAKKAILIAQNIIEKAGVAIKQVALLLTTREAWKSIASTAMAAFESAAKIPFIGWAIGATAAAGAIALGATLMSKGDDVMSEGGYGKRTLLAPEGAIRLNDKDTVIAGTNLGGGEGGSMPSIDLTPMISAINEVRAAVDRLYSKDTSINMDGKKVGTTLVQGSYKVA